MLASYPSHPLAVRGLYEIGTSYLARGKSQEALAAFGAFLQSGGSRRQRRDTPRAGRAADVGPVPGRPGAPGPGQVRRGDRRLQGLPGEVSQRAPIGRRPAGRARRAGADRPGPRAPRPVRRRTRRVPRLRRAEPARRPRAATPVRGRARLYYLEKKYDEAIAAWETLAGKFPGTEPAGHAQFAIASIYENEKGEPATAIERYRKVAVEPWHGQAAQRIALMEAKSLSVITERTFRSGETPRLKIATRNLEKLTFTAYRIDPETYFRKKHTLSGVEALDIGLVAPDAEWTVRGAEVRQVPADRDDVRAEEAGDAGRVRREGLGREDAPGHDDGPGQRPRRDRQDVARASSSSSCRT